MVPAIERHRGVHNILRPVQQSLEGRQVVLRKAHRVCEARIHLGPVIAEDVVGDHAAQTVAHENDAIVLAGGVEAPQDVHACLTDGAAGGDVLRARAQVPRRVTQVIHEDAVRSR